MSESGLSFINRRDLTKSALRSGTAALLPAGGMMNSADSSRELLNVRHFGVTGEGRVDETRALQSIIDRAAEKRTAVFLPPGEYLTSELHIRPGIALMGIPAWNYRGPGGSVLRLASADNLCLLNLTDACGATIEGLALDGQGLGQNVHGILVKRSEYPKHEDGFRIERCQIMRFSGDGLHLSRVWCFSIRHSMLAANQGDGLNLRGWDGFLLDNWFSGNGRAGFAARHENEGASITFSSNRIEWNGEENMLITGSDGYQITGNFFDRAGTYGLALRKGRYPCRQLTITGNFFKRSGKLADPASHDSAHIFFEGTQGATCVGNSFHCGQDDSSAGVWSPSYGIVLQGLENCVISNNALHEAALRQTLLDLGAHGEGVVVRDNPGGVFLPGSQGR